MHTENQILSLIDFEKLLNKINLFLSPFGKIKFYQQYATAQGALKSRKPSETFSNHAWNGIIGTRGQYELNEKWTMPFHFDMGSGDSDKTWQAYIGLMYKTGKWEIGGGYRYLTWDFDDDDAFGKAFKNLIY